MARVGGGGWWRVGPRVITEQFGLWVGRSLEKIGVDTRGRDVWWCVGQAEVEQDFRHDVGVGQEGQDDHLCGTFFTAQGVDVENPFE